MLELSQYLENYLWPFYDHSTATVEHIMSIIMMLNEKEREGVRAVCMCSRDSECTCESERVGERERVRERERERESNNPDRFKNDFLYPELNEVRKMKIKHC